MTQWTNPGVPNTTVPEPDHRRVQLEDKLAEAKTRLIELAHDKKTLALAAIEGDTRALHEIETVRTEAKLVQDKIDLVMDAIAALDEVYAADARVEPRSGRPSARLICGRSTRRAWPSRPPCSKRPSNTTAAAATSTRPAF